MDFPKNKMAFTTTHGGTPGSPTLGRTFNVSTVSGLVLVKVHGGGITGQSGAICQGIARALKHDGPALVDVVSTRQELIMPPATTLEEAQKFGLFMMKAVLDGRGRQLIDLAQVNLRR